MNQRPIKWPVVISIALAAAARLLAQAPPDISDLPEKSPITQQDQDRLKQWSESRVADFEASVDDSNRMEALLRETVALLDRATPEFLDAFGKAMSTATTERFGQADPRATRYMAQILEAINSDETINGLLAGLKSPDPQTRWHCAAGLEVRVARAGVVAGSVVSAAEQQIGTEPHPVVRRYLYRMIFAVNDPADRITRITSALNASLDRIENAAPSALSAELTALERLNDPSSGLRDADQRLRVPLVKALAAILTVAVHRYVDPDRDPGDLTNLELLVMLSETALKSAAREAASGNSAPDVTKAMFNGGAKQADAMKAELAKWVGNDDAQGALNGDPWNVPVGGLPSGTTEPAATDATTN